MRISHMVIWASMVILAGATQMGGCGGGGSSSGGSSGPASGSLDTTYGIMGKAIDGTGNNDDITAMALQSDGKIIVVGSTTNGSDMDFFVARFTASGALDTDFDTDGMQLIDFSSGDDYAQDVAIQADGKIVVVGYAWISSDNDIAIARLNSNGSLDGTFGSSGIYYENVSSAAAHDELYGVAFDNSGDIVACGWASMSGQADFVVVRFSQTNGAKMGSETTLDISGDDFADAVAVQVDGKLVLAGKSSGISGGVFTIARCSSSLVFETSFTNTANFASGDDAGHDLVIQSDGKFVVAGKYYATDRFRMALVRFKADGSLDTTFDADGLMATVISGYNSVGNAIALQSDGKILVAGYNDTDPSPGTTTGQFAVVRYNTNGSHDTSFDGDGIAVTSIASGYDARAFGIAIQSNGKIVVGGTADIAGVDIDVAIVRYHP